MLCVSSIISCQKDIVEPESLYSLLNLKEDHQFFAIPLDSTVTVKGIRGTEITLHSQDFELNNSDDLKLTLIELQNPMDFVMHDVQTTSGDKWLNSEGSYFIEVTQNGLAVALKEDHTIQVRFPKITNQSMELFKGERLQNGDIDWNKLDISLDYKDYQTFLIRDTLVLDEFNTHQYGVDVYMELPIIENKGLMPRKESEQLFNNYKVDSVLTLNDTLVGINYKKYLYLKTNKGIDSTLNTRDASAKEIRRLLKNQNAIAGTIDSLKTKWKTQSQEFDKEQNIIREKQKLLYKEIKLADQDWINVGHFNEFQFDEEVTLTITNKDYIESLYAVFDQTKTVVKMSFQKTIDVPKNESFTIVGFKVTNQGELMGYRRDLKLKEDTSIQLEFTKMTNSEIKKWLYQE